MYEIIQSALYHVTLYNINKTFTALDLKQEYLCSFKTEAKIELNWLQISFLGYFTFVSGLKMNTR